MKSEDLVTGKPQYLMEQRVSEKILDQTSPQ